MEVVPPFSLGSAEPLKNMGSAGPSPSHFPARIKKNPPGKTFFSPAIFLDHRRLIA
jgi:hypothetical protein